MPHRGRSINPGMTVKELHAHPSEAELAAYPPAGIVAEVALAAERVEELRSLGRSFHFEREATSGRVVAELRCLDSGAACTVPLSVMLDVMGGGALPV
jgi:hypothetical protein